MENTVTYIFLNGMAWNGEYAVLMFTDLQAKNDVVVQENINKA